MTFGGFAEAFECGEPEAIAYRWRQYLQLPSARARHMLELRDFLAAASGEPRLRALLPFTSHNWVTADLPICAPFRASAVPIPPALQGFYDLARGRADILGQHQQS